MKYKLLFFIMVYVSSIKSYAQCGGGYWLHKSHDFEADSLDIIIDTNDVVNPWQIGTPQKIILNTALSPSRVLITDSTNGLLANDTSYATVVIPLEGSYWTYFHFRHKYDIDSLHQKAWLECSYDSGENWILMDNIWGTADCDAQEKYWYECVPDTLDYVEGPYFSGAATEWKHSGYYWVWWMVIRADETMECFLPPETMLVRFVFANDSIQTSREGWMIDDLEIFNVQPVGGVENVDGVAIGLFPNPTDDFLTVVADRVSQIQVRSLLSGAFVGNLETRYNTIDVSNIPSGTYILSATLADGSVGRKLFVKQ